MEDPKRYHIWIDGKGYICEARSYRVNPAPLLGTRFATGRAAYSSLDFWQIGGITDFTKGINQKFLADSSQYYHSIGIDVSNEGEFKLERDLKPATFYFDGYPTARYRSLDALWIGTSKGKIYKTIDGVNWTVFSTSPQTRIYSFFEVRATKGNVIFATKGPESPWKKEPDSDAFEEVKLELTGTALFTHGSVDVVGHDTKFKSELWKGCYIQLPTHGIWCEVESIESDSQLKLSEPYQGEDLEEKPFLKLSELYYVMCESDYFFGTFNDGVRQSLDGINWKPKPPDPLWTFPASEGLPTNAIPINRGFLIGTKRSLWLCIGGGSGLNIWSIPDYANEYNFVGMCRWGPYGVFSVENQGIFYTDGSGIYPTSLNWQAEPFKCVSCRGIVNSGWDVFALVSDGTDWYLARSNLIYTRTPKYWWLVKKLTREPAYISSFSYDKVFIHYLDGSSSVYDKSDDENYQQSGSLETSLYDEGMILLQKFYRSVNAIVSDLPKETSISLGYRLDENNNYTEKEFSFSEDQAQKTITYILPNPTLGNRIQTKAELKTSDKTKTPVVSDLMWEYFLERPASSGSLKRTWSFVIIAEDRLEKLDLDAEEPEMDDARTRRQILNDLWESRNKKGLINFVGADNVETPAFEMKYSGPESSCTIDVDRTNCSLSIYKDGVFFNSIDYSGKTIAQVVDEINAFENFTAVLDPSSDPNQSAEDLIPEFGTEIKSSALLYTGTDVHSVVWLTQAPSQYKLEFEGRGSDRIQVGLREA